METASTATCPQRAEGITACRWMPIAEALQTISYANAKTVLQRAGDMVGEALPRR
jgi:hypothetical protein